MDLALFMLRLTHPEINPSMESPGKKGNRNGTKAYLLHFIFLLVAATSLVYVSKASTLTSYYTTFGSKLSLLSGDDIISRSNNSLRNEDIQNATKAFGKKNLERSEKENIQQIDSTIHNHEARFQNTEYFATITEWPIPLKPQSSLQKTMNLRQDSPSLVHSEVTAINHNDTNIHWCIIGEHSNSRTSRKYFTHFPHSAEALLPCWSWWRRWDAVPNCGIILMDGLRIPINTWQDQLVRFVWKCRVRRYTKYGVRRKRHPLNRTHPLGPSHIYYTPSLYWKNPRYGRINYFELPEDAWALRRCFISDHDILTVKRGVLQIGILQREKSRSITNLPELVSLLEKGIPDANITILDIIPPSLHAQAVWFATKDIIIASHGAALMNCIFILPRTIVMQLYPPNYFFQSLESIIESVGGIALDWYEGTDPVYDWHQAVREGRNNVARDANITAPPHEIVDPILFTMGRKPTPLEWENVNNESKRTKNLLWMN